MNRLHVRRLVSFGVVEKGDNPEADILFWKRAPLEASGRSAAGDLSPVSGADRGRAQGREIIRRIEKNDAKIADLAEGHRVLGDEIDQEASMGGPRITHPAGSIREEVDRLAVDKFEKGEAATLIQARPMVWRERPDLVAKARHEAPESAGNGSGKTINDRVHEVIDEATRRASWQPLMKGWGDGKTRKQIIAKVRVEMWRTPDGRELRDLDRAFGSKPYTPTTSREIRKSRGGGRYERALNLLDSGIWEE